MGDPEHTYQISRTSCMFPYAVLRGYSYVPNSKESKAPWGSSADYTGYPNDAYTPWAPMPGGYSPWTGSLLPSIPQEIPVGHVHGSRGPSMGYTPWVPPRSVDSTGYLVGTPWAPPRSLDYTGYPMGTRSGSPPPEVPPSFYASRDLSADGTGIISP